MHPNVGLRQRESMPDHDAWIGVDNYDDLCADTLDAEVPNGGGWPYRQVDFDASDARTVDECDDCVCAIRYAYWTEIHFRFE